MKGLGSPSCPTTSSGPLEIRWSFFGGFWGFWGVFGGFLGFFGKCLGDDLGVLSGFAVYFWVFWVFGFFGCFERFFEFSDNLGLK